MQEDFAGAAPDPPAQLVQLGEAEPLGVLDHHDARLRHVDADLDHRGRDQDLRRALGEGRHGGVLFAALHLAMDEPDLVAEISRKWAKRSCAAATSSASLSSTSGQTQKARAPAPIAGAGAR